MKAIQLANTFYNFDLVYSIDADYKQIQEVKNESFVHIEKFRL